MRTIFCRRKLSCSAVAVRLWLLAALLLQGCASLPEPPRIRIGCLPCPGALTLFTLADPSDLGVTQYEEGVRLFEEDETSHGIIYTRKAGFIDLAHLRMAMDWVRYAVMKVEPALRVKKRSIEFPGHDGSTFRLSFRYPRDWDAVSRNDRIASVDRLAREIGQRVAFDAMTWHEITTWYGYRTTLVWPERPSSFTYEDSMSHVVGIFAANRALLYGAMSWNQHATRALNETLKELGVVSRPEAARVMERIEDTWCKHEFFNPRRMVDIGQKTGRIYPWLVREPAKRDQGPFWFSVPGPKIINGRDYRNFYTVEIRPQLLAPARIRELCPGKPEWLDTGTHFPLILEDIRKELLEEYGPKADRPYEAPAGPL